MAKAPQFPWFVRNWLCSRTVATMSGDSVKAYVFLLCEAWLQIPRATLPNEDKELASMARLNIDQWNAIKPDVLRAFKTGSCKEHFGRLYSELQLECSRKYEANQRPNNKNAKRTRKNTHSSRACDNDNAITNDNTIHPKEKELLREFCEYRKEIKRPIMSIKSLYRILTNLRKLSNNDMVKAKAIIDRSVENGWQGLFELPEKRDNQQKNVKNDNWQPPQGKCFN